MNIIDWLNSNFDAGDAIIGGMITLGVWFVLWKLLMSKLFEKYKLYSFLELGVFGTFGIFIFLSLIVVLIIASIQAVIQFGAMLVIPLLLFWGCLIAFSIFFIKKIRE